NFPNPFNPETSIEYHVARSGHVKLTVHTLLGDVAAVLVNEHETAGMYKVVWNAASLTSGVYFVRMEAATNDGRPFTATRKVVLMK
ncbi:MAG TPA: peptidase S8, partial [Bacteroidetes bacterium]|nr:peptidase S8 [Bacteroidota bacterium]